MIQLRKILKFLEDPKYPCLGLHIRCLSFLGLWHPDMKSTKARIKLTFFYFTIGFFMSQYIKCLIKFDTDSLTLILQYAPFHMGVAKSCLFQWNYKRWERLIKFISSEELHEISTKDEKQDRIISGYIKRSRYVTYFFFGLAFFSNFGIFTEPYQKNQIVENGTNVYVYMFDGYTPFPKEPPWYYCSMFIQTVVGHMMSACVVCWDMLVISIMIFFAGQLRISRLLCKQTVDPKDAEESHRNIAACHRFHVTLIRYQREFSDLISPVMFLYLIVICISLGVCIIQIAEIEDDLPTLVSGCVYIGACLVQLLLFYWHANEVTVEVGTPVIINLYQRDTSSELVRYSTFKSNWVDADNSVQKEVALLAQTTRTRLIFKAGTFTEMSLSTFIGILRSSYSLYTLMKGTN